jgi:hypothetical protein
MQSGAAEENDQPRLLFSKCAFVRLFAPSLPWQIFIVVFFPFKTSPCCVVLCCFSAAIPAERHKHYLNHLVDTDSAAVEQLQVGP